jgi:GSH-dependent disulfide-bond oxidoreductase
MIEVHAFATPNSVRVPIALEEMGLPYTLKSVNVRNGEQKLPAHMAINPNGKVPVIIDSEGPDGKPFVLTESGAILVYLAEKTGKLIPSNSFGRARVLEQMFFHVSGIGPAFGHLGYFKRQAPENDPLAIGRFQTETDRVMAVLDTMLEKSQFAAGDLFSIADIMHFGWLWRREFAMVELNRTPNVERWFNEVSRREGVQRGVQRVNDLVPTT